MNRITELTIQNIHPKWKVLLNTPISEDKLLIDLLDEAIIKIVELKGKNCPDNPDKILRCLRLDPDLIKVVIVNNEPYPTPGIATGLALACEDKFLPSLTMLVRELEQEYNDPTIHETFDGTLTKWEKQGVLLLNSSLSCEQFKPGSHFHYWNDFTTGLLRILNDFKITRSEGTSSVFVFLGRQAQLFQNEINEKLHYKILRYHPVAEDHGDKKFEGFFKEVNKCLEESNQEIIQWYENRT